MQSHNFLVFILKDKTDKTFTHKDAFGQFVIERVLHKEPMALQQLIHQ